MEITFLKAKIPSQNRIWASIWYKRIEALAMVKTELIQNICNLAKLAPHTAFTLFCNALLTCMCRYLSVGPTFVESATSTDRHIFWNPLLTNTNVLSLSWTYVLAVNRYGVYFLSMDWGTKELNLYDVPLISTLTTRLRLLSRGFRSSKPHLTKSYPG